MRTSLRERVVSNLRLEVDIEKWSFEEIDKMLNEFVESVKSKKGSDGTSVQPSPTKESTASPSKSPNDGTASPISKSSTTVTNEEEEIKQREKEMKMIKSTSEMTVTVLK